uniref:Uncharacterized protein n=1 Tax=Glossina palpalis gambiensis TaxID=67801 RepID=A0A1B0B0T5_9MUSC
MLFTLHRLLIRFSGGKAQDNSCKYANAITFVLLYVSMLKMCLLSEIVISIINDNQGTETTLDECFAVYTGINFYI